MTEDSIKLYGRQPSSKYKKKKNAVCSINECTLFSYVFEEKTQDFTKKISEIEWCHVTISTPIADFFEEEGYVKAEDLKECKFSKYALVKFYHNNKVRKCRFIIP